MTDLRYDAPPDTDALSLSALTNATHRKQVIYAGKFVKAVPGKPRIEFEVTPETMDRWATDGNQMLSEGITCTMPLEHAGAVDPEKKRGEVIQWERAYDSKGRDGLFAHFSFVDDKAAKKLSTTDVSIWVPESYTNAATAKKYDRPIRHVAFTDYPVIPGLEKTETLSLSFEEPTMSYRKLAEKLGVKVAADASEDDIEAAIVEFKSKPAEPVVTKPAEPVVTKPADADTRQPLAAGFVNMAVESRDTKIDSLVNGGHITPAAAKKMKEKYASKEVVTLALSEDGTFSDGFDDMFDVMKENTALSLGERSGRQSGKDMSDPKANPLVADAKRRAEAAAAAK